MNSNKSIHMTRGAMHVAILIDGDNVSYADAKFILAKATEFGEICSKRVYGDFLMDTLKNWKQTANDYGIKMIQTTQYIRGKNTTDIEMVIDAMNMLFTKDYDEFCIATGDSDFTSLATALKEQNKVVRIFGYKDKAPNALKLNGDFIDINSLKLNSSVNSDKKITPQKIKCAQATLDLNKNSNTTANLAGATQDVNSQSSSKDTTKSKSKATNSGAKMLRKDTPVAYRLNF